MYVVPPIFLSLLGGAVFTLPAMKTPPFCPTWTDMFYDKYRPGYSGAVCFLIGKVSRCPRPSRRRLAGRSIGPYPSPHSRGGASYAVTHSRRKYHHPPGGVTARGLALGCSQRGVPRSCPTACGTIPARPLYGSPLRKRIWSPDSIFWSMPSAACQPVKARLAVRDAL